MRLVVAALLVASCGDVYADPGGTADAEGPSPPTVDAVPSAPADFFGACPEGRPRENTSCAGPKACEYGSSSDRACNDVIVCNDSSWTRRPSESCFAYACPPPSNVAALDGQPCSLGSEPAANDNDEVVCDVSDGICACTTGPDGAHAHSRRWACVREQPLDCPAHRPRAGESCEGQIWCDYGNCLFKRGMVMECLNGAWVTGGTRCE